MLTATRTRTTRKSEVRSMRLTTIGNADVLWLTVGKLTTAYRLTRLPSDHGTAYRLEKADHGNGTPETYDVCLMDGGRSTCECKGHLQHGHKTVCKHIAALALLTKQGKLQSTPKPAARQPVITNADEPMARVLLGGEGHRQQMPARVVNPCCFNCGKSYEACDCTI
jgi:hypothetical protein